jgi:hypothetical protein
VFSRTSRYANVPEAISTGPDGRPIPYKLLRVTPDVIGIQNHAVVDGDRLDLLASRYYRDPEQYWRICDGNQALRPDDLTSETGRRLLIPLAQG